LAKTAPERLPAPEAETPRPAAVTDEVSDEDLKTAIDFRANGGAEFPDDAKVSVTETRAPDWQNDAYLLLNEFRAHGDIMQFLQDKASNLINPASGQRVLGNLHSDDRAACVRMLLPFVADSRVARFCGVGPKDN
jgi:hypothetical protein